MECNSSDSNVSRQKRKRTEDDKTRSAMLDFGVLDCPICIEPLSIPIFQVKFHILHCFSFLFGLQLGCDIYLFSLI